MLATDIRARKLDDIVGQDTIVKGLKNYFKTNSVPDVIYFIGNSGSGKTTLAYLTAMTLNCHNPIKEEDGSYSPCGECPSCKDIISERFQRDIHVYNGGQLKVDGIEQIEDQLTYSAMTDKNLIFILNEAHMITSIKKFLAIIEKPRDNVYFFLTSTDKDKFKNVSSSFNKDQETTALRSRGAFFNIKPIATSIIKDYLFNLLEKLDPENKIPDIFLEEGLQVIAENSHGNIRMAINDFSQCINSEAFTLEETISLLGYEDEKKYIDIIYQLAQGKPEAFKTIQDLEDVQGFFYYSWKILTDISIRDTLAKPFKEEWKEKTANAILKTHNFDKILSIYIDTNKNIGSYFNNNVFFNSIYLFYKSLIPNGVSTQNSFKMKKLKKLQEIK